MRSADAHARQGEWVEALTALGRTTTLKPSYDWGYFKEAAIAAYLEDLHPYDCICFHMLGQFRDTDDPGIAERALPRPA